jgi:tetratricopeptide (TPR) repeat protein
MPRHRAIVSILCCTLSLFPPAFVAAPAGGHVAAAKSAAPGTTTPPLSIMPLAVSDDTKARVGDDKRTVLRLYFAGLLLAQGEIAEIAEAAGDETLLLDMYVSALSKAITSNAMGNASDYLDKALLLADKIPNYDKGKLIDICVVYAGGECRFAPPTNTRYDLEFYERAYKLMSDSDPRKPNILSIIASLRSRSKAYGPLTVAQAAQEAKDSAAAKLPTLIEAAELAEKTNRDDAFRIWTSAAYSARQIGDIDAFLKYLYKAMDNYAKHLDPGNPIEIYALNCLVEADRKDDAVKLLDAAIARSRIVAGAKSNLTQRMLGTGFEFYLKQGQKVQALEMLDQALACDMTTGAGIRWDVCNFRSQADAVSFVSHILGSLPDREQVSNLPVPQPEIKSDDAFVLTVLKKVLAAQRAAMKPTDDRFVMTLRALGYFYHRTGKYKEAQMYYDEAFKICASFCKPGRISALLGKGYIANLKKLGRMKEATEYEATLKGVY